MKRLALFLWLALFVFSIKSFGVAGSAKQNDLRTDTDIHGQVLKFDWPAIQIGVGSYEEGPTGLRIFRFPHRAVAAVDVRGFFLRVAGSFRPGRSVSTGRGHKDRRVRRDQRPRSDN
jgi:hypothetical protein